MNKTLISFFIENLIVFFLFIILSEIEKTLIDYSEWSWVGNVIIFIFLITKLTLSIIIYRLTKKIFEKKIFVYYIVNFLNFLVIAYVYDNDFLKYIISNEGLIINIYLLSHLIGTVIMLTWYFFVQRGKVSNSEN